jgi:hypothetical protein
VTELATRSNRLSAKAVPKIREMQRRPAASANQKPGPIVLPAVLNEEYYLALSIISLLNILKYVLWNHLQTINIM